MTDGCCSGGRCRDRSSGSGALVYRLFNLHKTFNRLKEILASALKVLVGLGCIGLDCLEGSLSRGRRHTHEIERVNGSYLDLSISNACLCRHNEAFSLGSSAALTLNLRNARVDAVNN